MFRPMRRAKQALPQADIETILQTATSGVLALHGDDGYPYAVPLSFVYAGGKLYFHCAKQGHKVDAVKQNAKASFCVISQDTVIPEQYTTHFKSVIAFGRVRVVEEETAKRAAIETLALKYAPQDSAANRQQAIDREWAPLCMLEMTIDHVTGKQAVELMRRQQQG